MNTRNLQLPRPVFFLSLVLSLCAVPALYGQTFQQPLLVNTGSQPAGIAAPSLTLNAAPALCYSNPASASAGTTLQCRANQAGTFPAAGAAVPLLVHEPPFAFADFDGDGKADVLTLGALFGSPQATLELRKGSGDGSFQMPIAVTVLPQTMADSNWTQLGFARFTSSGRLDAYAVDNGSQKLIVALNKDGTFFAPAAALSLPDGGAASVLTGDFNGDGKTDILVLGTGQRVLSAFNGNDDGTFTSGASWSLPDGIFSVLLADIDGDHRPDLIVEGVHGALSYFPGLAAGGFASTSIVISGAQDASTGHGGHLIAVADRNGDGIADIVTSTPLGISVLLGQALSSGAPYVVGAQLLGIYDPGQANPAAGRTSFAVADFNSDGLIDLAVDNPQGVLILFGKADGGFYAPLVPGLSFASNPDPSVYGADFTLTATLSAPQSGAPTPTGTVTFSVDGAVVGTTALTGSLASYTVAAPTLLRGSHTISAAYSGDSTYTSATITGTHTINGLRSQTTFTLAPASTPSIVYGQIADGVGSVSAIDSAAGATINGGTISFFENGNLICVLPINGIPGTCPNSAGAGLSVGQHTITAAYSGNDYYEPSSSDPATGVVQVLPDDTTATVASSLNPSNVGQAVTFTAAITAPYATPAGTVNFYDGATLLGTAMLTAGGTATLTTSSLTLGTHNITASYAATTNFNASVSNVLVQVVNQPLPAATVTLLTSSVNPSVVGQTVTFTASVGLTAVAVGQNGAPTGNVNFMVDGLLVNPIALNASGMATISTSTLTAGTHTVIASYAGGTAFAASVSATLVQVVDPLGAGNFTLSVSPSSLAVPIGSSVSVLVTVTPLNGFAQPVNLSCTGIPDESSCTFDSATIPAGGGSTRLTVYAAAPHNCGTNTPYFVASGPVGLLDALATAAVMFLLRRRRRLLKGLALMLIFSVLPALSGCAGNCTDLGVRPGTYSFVVTGVSGGSPAITVSQAAQFTAHL